MHNALMLITVIQLSNDSQFLVLLLADCLICLCHLFQLALRTVSSSRSAYACFLFNESFFISYEDGSNDQPADSQEEDLFKCKIAMKVRVYHIH